MDGTLEKLRLYVCYNFFTAFYITVNLTTTYSNSPSIIVLHDVIFFKIFPVVADAALAVTFEVCIPLYLIIEPMIVTSVRNFETPAVDSA